MVLSYHPFLASTIESRAPNDRPKDKAQKHNTQLSDSDRMLHESNAKTKGRNYNHSMLKVEFYERCRSV